MISRWDELRFGLNASKIEWGTHCCTFPPETYFEQSKCKNGARMPLSSVSLENATFWDSSSNAQEDSWDRSKALARSTLQSFDIDHIMFLDCVHRRQEKLRRNVFVTNIRVDLFLGGGWNYVFHSEIATRKIAWDLCSSRKIEWDLCSSRKIAWAHKCVPYVLGPHAVFRDKHIRKIKNFHFATKIAVFLDALVCVICFPIFFVRFKSSPFLCDVVLCNVV